MRLCCDANPPLVLLGALVGALLMGCDQQDPGEPGDVSPDAGGGMGPDAATPEGDLADDFYPMVAGARWVYRHVGGSTPWDETVELTATRYMGRAALEQGDTEGPGGARSLSTLIDDGGRVDRVHKDVYEDDELTSQVEYDPGFARFDRAWVERDAGFSETLMYTRTAVDADGMLMAMGERSHVFTVADKDAEVSVPAGTFTGCIEIRRERIRAPDEAAADGDSKRFWFCAGVGKVKEIDLTAGKIEELVSCDVPMGGCPGE